MDKLSSGTPTQRGEVSGQVWEQLHEYIVKYYKRLDKGARAYADEIFDQLDASLKQKIDSLPHGREKKVLSRKLAMVRGKRSPLPILYLDTPVIENFIRQGLGQPLSGPGAANTEALFSEVSTLVKDGKLICPEDTFHREALQMGSPQARQGLDILRGISEGLSFRHSQTIEDFQIFRALRGFINENGSVNYRTFWVDAFQMQAVSTIMKKRSSILFKGTLALAETPGARAEQQGASVPSSTRLRVRYDETALKDEHQLRKRSARHLRDLVRLGMRYQAIRGEAEKRHLDGFWAGQKIDLSVALWNHFGGKPEGLEGLISFYESAHFSDVPAIKIKRDVWNAFSANCQQGSSRVTGPPDITVLSAILPYTDMMILGPGMTDVVRDRLRLDTRFDTQICSMDEHEMIMAGLKQMTR